MATLEVRLARSHHPNRLRLRQRFTLERTEPCANAAARERVDSVSQRGHLLARPGTTKQLTIELLCKVSRQDSNPWGSVLRVACVTNKQSHNSGCTLA